MGFELSNRHRFYFNEICQIPHGSKNEKALSDYIVAFAKENNLRYVQDDMWNVIVYKEGTSDSKEPILIQAHIDMVCEKNVDSNHNFETDPLDLYVEDNHLMARGTTLGADDGHGAAYMLAILEDKTLIHPPIECAFTTQEEIGLFGAIALKSEFFNSKRLITLDGGGETRTLLSSAGGARVCLSKELSFEENNKPTFKLMIKGLKGGHSGGCIDLERGNSNKLLVRLLKELQLNGVSLNLVSINGGLKDNAIPRESECLFVTDCEKVKVQAILDKSIANISEELKQSDSEFKVIFSEEAIAEQCLVTSVSNQFIDAIYLAPNGMIAKSMAIEGLTLVSLNLGVIFIAEDKVNCVFSLRSAIDSSIDNLINQLKTIASLFCFDVSIGSRYPGWNYNPVSNMRDVLNCTINELYDKDLEVVATHGGCEVGVFSSLIPGLDVVSLGPLTYDIHTPDERMDLASFDRVYTTLTNYISKL